jgi:hypothetical protein
MEKPFGSSIAVQQLVQNFQSLLGITPRRFVRYCGHRWQVVQPQTLSYPGTASSEPSGRMVGVAITPEIGRNGQR